MVPVLARVVLVSAAVLTACQPQEDGAYPGEPLARMSGTIRNLRTEVTPEAAVVIVWVGFSDDSVGAEKAEVSGTFPAAFTFDVLAPPEDEVGLEGAIGFLLVVDERVSGEGLDSLRDGLLGASEAHVLLYAETDVAPDGELARILGVAPAAGFHLMEVVSDPLSEADELESAADGFQTPLTIELVDDPSSIDLPNPF